MHSFRIAILTIVLLCISVAVAQAQADESQTVVLFKSGAAMRGTVEYSADSSRVVITRAGDGMRFEFKSKELFKITDEAGLEAARQELHSLPPEKSGLRLFGSAQVGTITEAKDYSGHLYFNLGVMVSPTTGVVGSSVHELDFGPANFIGLGVQQALTETPTHLYLTGGVNYETSSKAFGTDLGVGIQVALTSEFSMDFTIGSGRYDTSDMFYTIPQNGTVLPTNRKPQNSMYFRLGFSFTGSE